MKVGFLKWRRRPTSEKKLVLYISSQRTIWVVNFTLKNWNAQWVPNSFRLKMAWKCVGGPKPITFNMLGTKIDQFYFEGLNFIIRNMWGTVCLIFPKLIQEALAGEAFDSSRQSRRRNELRSTTTTTARASEAAFVVFNELRCSYAR